MKNYLVYKIGVLVLLLILMGGCGGDGVVDDADNQEQTFPIACECGCMVGRFGFRG